MGYHLMSPEKLSALYRRWRDGQRFAEIARNEGLDRKTVRKYVSEFAAAALDQIPNGDGRFIEGMDRVALGNARPHPSSSAYEPYLNEILGLIQHETEPLKPKTAWGVVRGRHGLTASYSAFKRFVAKQHLVRSKRHTGIRIETPAGDEVQVDYGQVGTMTGPDGKRHVVYAFVAVLSYSRMMFIQFTFRQTTSSFVQSHVLLFSYLGGVPRRVVIDNLKSGILKADFWDPELNHAYRELAEHYNTFIDPARVRTPQDKGKVERQVPVARELFRMLRNLHPHASVEDLSSLALAHLGEVHAERKHGTTQIAPRVLFEKEKPQLKPLPEDIFEIPLWKKAKVSADRFFQFEGRFYALPNYVGKEVWLRKCGKILKISHNGHFVRHYAITGRRFNFLAGDLSPYEEAIQKGEYPSFLLEKARRFGEDAVRIMEHTLRPSAWVNCRRGQALLRVLEKYGGCQGFRNVLPTAIERNKTDWRAVDDLFAAEANKTGYPQVLSAAQLELMHDQDSFWKQKQNQGV